jgi:hypothetical protein
MQEEIDRWNLPADEPAEQDVPRQITAADRITTD